MSNQQQLIENQTKLIQLLEDQIQDLTMMSKIELGDDVIAEIWKLTKKINELKQNINE
jgi:hypothetical protein